MQSRRRFQEEEEVRGGTAGGGLIKKNPTRFNPKQRQEEETRREGNVTDRSGSHFTPQNKRFSFSVKHQQTAERNTDTAGK